MASDMLLVGNGQKLRKTKTGGALAVTKGLEGQAEGLKARLID